MPKNLLLICIVVLATFCGCADTNDPTENGSGTFGIETIDSNDEYIVFSGSVWSNVTFPHLEHAQREGNDCFICHDHGATVGDSKWNCSACHTSNDPENLCDQDTNHGCIMAQCELCHQQRGGAAPSTSCSGEGADTDCCVDCHTGGIRASSGVLLDSAIEGVSYQTPTISGVTNTEGGFYYQPGETVSFSIADLFIGQTTGSPILTIVDLVEGATDASHPTVTNVCRLLLTMDQDGDPDNGITLSTEIIEAIRGRNINFDQSPEAFGSDQRILTLLNALNDNNLFSDDTPRELCSPMDAQEHLSETIYSINYKPLVTFPGSLSISGSIGCSTTGCHSVQKSANGLYQIDETNYPGGLYNGRPVYKNTSTNQWIHWNTAGTMAMWKVGDRVDRRAAEHYYSQDRSGGSQEYPPLGAWPSGCATNEGKQIIASVIPMGGIIGEPWVGEEIIGTYRYYDEEGDIEDGTSFQWYRCDDTIHTSDVPIAGANTDSYVLTIDDQGKYIRFGVTPGSRVGNSPGDEIKSGPAGPIIVNQPPVSDKVTVKGEKHVAATLVGSYSYSDAEGDEESGTVFSWYRSDDSSGSGEILIAGGTGTDLLHYCLLSEDQGKYIKFSVTPSASTGASPGLSADSLYVGPIQPDPLNQVPSASIPTVSGNNGCRCVNSELTASYTYSDAENDPESSTYQWYLETSVGSGLFEAISGATSLTYTVTDDCDEGKLIRFEVTPQATVGNSPGASQQSAPIQIGQDPQNNVPLVTVSIQSPVYVGFNANIVYSYSDSENNEDRSVYRWYVCDDTNGTSCGSPVLAGSLTAETIRPALYTPTENDEGKFLKIEVLPVSMCGNSPGTMVESGTVQVHTNPSGNRPPYVSGVAITGVARIGATLQGQYDFVDLDIPPDEDCSSYQWYHSGNLAGPFTAIDGATLADFTPPDNGLYEGGYLQFGVSPWACTGENNQPPTEVRSPAVGPLEYSESNLPPVVSNVVVQEETIPSGETECLCVSSGLMATYNYFDTEGAPENPSASICAWYVSDDNIWTTEDYATPVASGIRFTPPDSSYEGRWCRFGVRAASSWGNPELSSEALSTAFQIGPDRNNAVPVAIMPSGIQVSMSDYADVNGVYQIDDTYANGQFNSRPIYKHLSNSYWICYSGNNRWMIVTDPQATDWSNYDFWSNTENYVRHHYDGSSATPPYWYWSITGPNTPGATACVSINHGITGVYNHTLESEEVITGSPGTMPVGLPNNPWAVGATLVASWEYSDTEGDAESSNGHRYQWYRCNADGSSCTAISGATAESYTTVIADAGHYLKFSVAPAALSGNSPGQAAESMLVGPVERVNVFTGEFHTVTDVDYWTFHIDQTSDVEIIGHAKEPCGGKPMPNDFFDDGARNNMDFTNAVFWFFPSDSSGNISAAADGFKSYEAPGSHSTLAGYTPYMIFPGPNPDNYVYPAPNPPLPDLEALSPGWYTIAIGAGDLTETEARNHAKETAADEVGYYQIFITATPN